MPSPVTLEYQGAAGPQALSEEVPFTVLPALPAMAGLASSTAVALLMAVVEMSLLTSAPTSSAAFAVMDLMDRYLWLRLLAPVIVGTSAAFFTWRRTKHLQVCVGPGGIRVMRARVVERDCPWSRIRVVRIFGMRELADERGNPFGFLLLACRHPEASLARRVLVNMRSQRNLPRRTMAPALRRIVCSVSIGAGVILALGCFFPFGRIWSAEKYANVGPWFASLIAGIVFLVVGCWLLLIDAQVDAGSPAMRWDSELAVFVTERKGRLDGTEMPEGIWFRYVDQKAMRALVKRLVFPATACLYLGMVSLIGSFLLDSFDPISSVYGTILGLALVVRGLMMVRFGAQVGRPMGRRFRRVSDGFEVDFGDRVVYCEVLKEPTLDGVAPRYPGATGWVIQAATGWIYRIDPRFIVEAGPRPMEAATDPNLLAVHLVASRRQHPGQGLLRDP